MQSGYPTVNAEHLVELLNFFTFPQRRQQANPGNIIGLAKVLDDLFDVTLECDAVDSLWTRWYGSRIMLNLSEQFTLQISLCGEH